MTAPRVLLVTFNRLLPADQGNARRILQLVRLYEEQGFEVDLLYHAEEGLDAGLLRGLQQRFGRVRVLTPRMSKRIHPGHVCHIADWFDPGLTGLALDMHRLRGYRVVHVNYIWYAPLLWAFGPEVLKVLDSHDLYADRAAAYRQAGMEPSWFSTTATQEDEAFRLADAVLAIQRDEARVMAARGHRNIVYLPYLEPATRAFAPRAPGQPLVLGYLGSGNDWNVRSMRLFLDAWSARGARPPFQLLLAGGICRHLHEVPGVVPIGVVKEVRRFYEAIDVALNPMVGGTGLKIKTVEPLAYGRPVLSTPDGIHGLNGLWQLPVPQSPADLVRYLRDVLGPAPESVRDALLAQAQATRAALDAEEQDQRERFLRWLGGRLAAR